jgi:hypothetical protein
MSAVRRRTRDASASKLGSLGVKVAGVLLKHGSFETAQGVAAMRRPLEALADALRYLAPLEIYPDWSPPRDPAHVRVPLPAVATASAQKNSDNDASKALINDQTSFWNSGSCKTAWWSVALDPPAPVASVQIQFRPQQMPDTVIVEVTSTGPGRSAPAWQVAATMSGKALGEFTLIEFREAFTAAQVWFAVILRCFAVHTLFSPPPCVAFFACRYRDRCA